MALAYIRYGFALTSNYREQHHELKRCPLNTGRGTYSATGY